MKALLRNSLIAGLSVIALNSYADTTKKTLLVQYPMTLKTQITFVNSTPYIIHLPPGSRLPGCTIVNSGPIFIKPGNSKTLYINCLYKRNNANLGGNLQFVAVTSFVGGHNVGKCLIPVRREGWTWGAPYNQVLPAMQSILSHDGGCSGKISATQTFKMPSARITGNKVYGVTTYFKWTFQ